MIKRTDRLNSLLQEVIAEVILKEIRNPKISTLLTVKKVEITKDLHYAKVYISMLGSELEKKQTLKALKSAAGFISSHASKKVVMRFFPALTFKLDESVDKYMAIDSLLGQIHKEEQARQPSHDSVE